MSWTSGRGNQLFPLLLISLCSGTSWAAPQRSIIIRSVDRESETHLKIRASALENDSTGVFPISTLDKNSFTLLLEKEKFSGSTLGLTTFDSARRWNNRAIVWAYDANGVKTMKGLNKELRALTAQEFIGFNADFLSILGVAQSRTFERVVLDQANQDNVLALQRQLLSDPTNIKPESVFKESAVCVAAQKFNKWTSSGLKNSDQKMLILIGGAAPISEQQRTAHDKCIDQLLKMRVIIHQIVFAKPETFQKRQWTIQPEVQAQGATYRVVDLQGASRALQATRNILDKEYVMSAQLPQHALSNTQTSELSLTLSGNYHGIEFISSTQTLRIQPLPTLSSTSEKVTLGNPSTNHPPRLSVVGNTHGLAVNAWFEWLATAVLIGLVVTIRHIRRMESGIFTVTSRAEHGDASQGPLLLVLNGKDQGREFRIRQKSVVLGRGLFCDLRLSSSQIKRKHGCLRLEGDKALIEDFSNGGIAVNGRPLRHLRVIGHGSVIQLGDLHLLFRCGES